MDLSIPERVRNVEQNSLEPIGSKDRQIYFDVLKIIAAFAVVMLHLSAQHCGSAVRHDQRRAVSVQGPPDREHLREIRPPYRDGVSLLVDAVCGDLPVSGNAACRCGQRSGHRALSSLVSVHDRRALYDRSVPAARRSEREAAALLSDPFLSGRDRRSADDRDPCRVPSRFRGVCAEGLGAGVSVSAVRLFVLFRSRIPAGPDRVDEPAGHTRRRARDRRDVGDGSSDETDQLLYAGFQSAAQDRPVLSG